MKILHISRTMNQGGAEKIVYQLCTHSFENIIQEVASAGGYYVDKLNRQKITHTKIPDIDNKNPVKMITTFLTLLKIIRSHKIDVIQTHHRMAAFYAQLIKIFFPRISLIYTAHNTFFNKKALLKFSVRNTLIIAVGNSVKRNLVEYYQIDTDRIKVIYNSIVVSPIVQPDVELNKLKSHGNILVGCIGRMTEQKGIDIFIDACAALVSDYPKLLGIIIGDGEKIDYYKDLAKKKHIENNIKFLGFRSDVFSLIKSLDFVVLSSRWEGFPLTPIETFAMGKTIVVSNIPGNEEIVENMSNGLTFRCGDSADLSLKIKSLIIDKKLRKALELEAMRSYARKYSYQTFLDKYQTLYNRMRME